MSPEQMYWQRLRAQHGVATVRQGRDLGLSAGDIRHLVDKGRLDRVMYGIVAAAGAPETPHFRMMIGVLAAASRSGDGDIRAAVCGPTAAYLLDLADPPRDGIIHVLSQRRVQRPMDGYLFHWSSRLPADEVVLVNGVPTTDAIRVWLDICDREPHRAPYILRRGLRANAFTLESIQQRIKKESRQGRSGLARARELVGGTSASAALARSAREEHYFELLVNAGYPAPERNVTLPGSFGHGWQVDLFYRDRGFCLEVSPAVTHDSDPWVHDKDRLKEFDLKAQGYDLVTVTDSMPDEAFLRLVREILGPPGQSAR